MQKVLRGIPQAGKAAFRQSLKALDVIDMVETVGELVAAEVDAVVFKEAEINQVVTALLAIGVDPATGFYISLKDSSQGASGDIFYDVRIDFAAALEQTHSENFATGSVLTFALDARRPEVAFTDLDHTI